MFFQHKMSAAKCIKQHKMAILKLHCSTSSVPQTCTANTVTAPYTWRYTSTQPMSHVTRIIEWYMKQKTLSNVK